MTRLLTIKEVRATLRCSRTYVYGLFRAQELRAIKLGRATRVSDADIDEFIARKAASAGGDKEVRPFAEVLHTETRRAAPAKRASRRRTNTHARRRVEQPLLIELVGELQPPGAIDAEPA